MQDLIKAQHKKAKKDRIDAQLATELEKKVKAAKLKELDEA